MAEFSADEFAVLESLAHVEPEPAPARVIPPDALCPDCGGSGFMETLRFDGNSDYHDCPTCQGDGVTRDFLDHLDHVEPVDHDYQLPEVKCDGTCT